jgi:hypothetical protein
VNLWPWSTLTSSTLVREGVTKKSKTFQVTAMFKMPTNYKIKHVTGYRHSMKIDFCSRKPKFKIRTTSVVIVIVSGLVILP